MNSENDLYHEFILDFSRMSGNLPQSIIQWFFQKGEREDGLGKRLVTLANTLYRMERFFEAYWVFSTIKTGFPEKEKEALIDRLINSSRERCIEKAFQWLEREVVCQPEDKPLLQKRLAENIQEILIHCPALGAMVLNALPDHRLAIRPIPGANLLEERRFSIVDLEKTPPQAFDATRVHEESFDRSSVEKGACFYGMGGGSQIQDIFNITKVGYPYPQIGMYLLETSFSVFKANMATHLWKGFFNSDRLFWHVGREGYDGFFQLLRDEKQLLPSIGFHIDPEISTDAPQKINAIVEEKVRDYMALTEKVEAWYRNRSALEWRELFHGKRPLKVLGITSIFTVFLQHCMRDWLDGFRSIGCETELLAEKSPTLRMTNLYSLDVIDRFKPDLILGICYNRSSLSFPVPKTIPFVNWQQDKLKLSRTPETIAGIKERDLIITTHDYTISWMLNDGYSRNKIYNFGYFPTNTSIYRPVKLSPVEHEKYRCDISFVSNCTQPAHEAFNRMCAEYQHLGSRWLKCFALFYEKIEACFTAWENYPYNSGDYDLMFKEFCEKEGMGGITDKGMEEIAYKFHYVGDRFLRHRPLEVLAAKGADLALYGNGWEKHPVLGRFARGIAGNGEELNKINNASKIVYHAISDVTLHQRFMDAAASGSFILVKHLKNDVDSVDRLFECGKEFVYFEGPKDIHEKVSYYLDHPEERERIAANASLRAQAYAYRQFAKKIIEIISKNPEEILAEQ